MDYAPAKYTLAFLRILMGWMFFWAFLDKLFGFGFATESGKAWINGVSPTSGFLANAVHGPFASFYQGLAGNAAVDWIYMVGLLLIGIALIFGICMKIAGYAGAFFMLMLWTSLLWPKNNPFLDDHVIYFFLLLSFAPLKAGNTLGLGRWWSDMALVKKYPILE